MKLTVEIEVESIKPKESLREGLKAVSDYLNQDRLTGRYAVVCPGDQFQPPFGVKINWETTDE